MEFGFEEKETGEHGGDVATSGHAVTAAHHLLSDNIRAVKLVPINRLTPYSGNARKHSRKQIRQIADSIERFGFNNPVLVDEAGGIIAGHGRVAAAEFLGLGDSYSATNAPLSGRKESVHPRR